MPFGIDDAFTVGSAAISGIKGIFDFFVAQSEEKKAKEELSRLKEPFYRIQNEYIQNRDIAGSMAASGLPEETKNFYTTEAQRGLGTTLNSVNMSGGSPNDAGRLMDVYLRNINKVAAEDASARVQNMQRFFDANRELAGQKTMQWTLNELRPYERKLKEITQRIGAAKTNKNNALNTAIGSAGAVGTALTNNDLMDKLFGSNQATTTDERIYADVAPISSEDARPEMTGRIPTGSQQQPAPTTKMGY